ncbi:hypothetical protein V2W45_318203 [Cenococcum geophilum]
MPLRIDCLSIVHRATNLHAWVWLPAWCVLHFCSLDYFWFDDKSPVASSALEASVGWLEPLLSIFQPFAYFTFSVSPFRCLMPF